jgi:hypothetical protein
MFRPEKVGTVWNRIKSMQKKLMDIHKTQKKQTNQEHRLTPTWRILGLILNFKWYLRPYSSPNLNSPHHELSPPPPEPSIQTYLERERDTGHTFPLSLLMIPPPQECSPAWIGVWKVIPLHLFIWLFTLTHPALTPGFSLPPYMYECYDVSEWS